MKERIIQLFADVLEIDPAQVGDETSPASVDQWDSLNHLNLIASFETEFSIDIEPEEIQPMMENFRMFHQSIARKMD